MKNNENTPEDRIRIAIAFLAIGLATIGVLLVAFGFFDREY
jgi:hypothetical protein